MKPSQKQQIREYLESGGKLTPKAALNFWGCFRLASRVHDINEDYRNEWLFEIDINIPQHLIKKTMVKTESGAWVAEYYLDKTL